MIIGVDIGGTKTFVAVFDENGEIKHQARFETNQDYSEFLNNLSSHTADLTFSDNDICCVAVPGLINRQLGTVQALGNLPWRDISIANDISQILNGAKVIIENDSKLAGLAEAHLLPESQRTLYITISTGIGAALVVDGQLSPDVIDMEIGKMPLIHEGEYKDWESFASGSAFIKRFGKRGEEVEDPEIWKVYADYIGEGVSVACSIFQLDSIVFGGGFGQYAERFIPYLSPFIERLHPVIKKPGKLIAAKYGDKSVIHGCYLYASKSQA